MFSTIKQRLNMIATKKEWQWFVGLYFTSLLILGAVYGLKHFVVRLLL